MSTWEELTADERKTAARALGFGAPPLNFAETYNAASEQGRPYGLSPLQVLSARRTGMPLEEFAALASSGPTVADFRSALGKVADDRKVREEAAHELAVERQKAALKGAA